MAVPWHRGQNHGTGAERGRLLQGKGGTEPAVESRVSVASGAAV